MAEPVRLLVLSKDPTLVQADAREGDARRRHIVYAQTLQRLYPGSEMRVLAPAPTSAVDRPCAGLALYGSGTRNRALYAADLMRRLPAALAGWQPTAITVQTPWEEGNVGAWLARRTHAAFLPQLHFDLFAAAWRAEHWSNPWRARLARASLRRATRIRVVSDAVAAALQAALGPRCPPIDVIPVGVDFAPAQATAAEARARLGLADAPTLLFVGRLVASKRLDHWLDVAARVLDRLPDARFLIAGDGPERTRLAQRLAATDPGRAVRLLGSVAHDELPLLYAAADAFLLTSSHEGFGRVLLEAALAGRPSVSTDCSGPRDLVRHGETGLLAPVSDVEALADAAVALLSDPARARAMGDAARQAAEARFGLQALAERLAHHWATRAP